MSIHPFQFKHFLLQQSGKVMKVSTDSILLASWARASKAARILDIGTGSGILALLLAQKSTAQIDAIDISQEAAALSNQNFNNSAWSKRLSSFCSSLQDFKPTYLYDLIISNPPYFENSLPAQKESRNVARHALKLSFKELLSHSKRLLKENGNCFFCVPAASFATFVSNATSIGFYLKKKLTINASPAKKPYLVLVQLSLKKCTENYSQITIYDCAGKYSKDFIALTKESYATDFVK